MGFGLKVRILPSESLTSQVEGLIQFLKKRIMELLKKRDLISSFHNHPKGLLVEPFHTSYLDSTLIHKLIAFGLSSVYP